MPEPQGETSLVEREIRIEASAETVFAFFTDPVMMVRWLGRAATLDPRPGGVFRINSVAGYFTEGEYLEVEPFTRIVFTWGYDALPGAGASPLPPGASTVEVQLVPDGEETLVRLSHRAPNALARLHAAGWDNYLPRLAIAAAGGTPGRDPFFDRFRTGSAAER